MANFRNFHRGELKFPDTTLYVDDPFCSLLKIMSMVHVHAEMRIDAKGKGDVALLGLA
jgi:hypothetical protein